ncbi:E3 ubiquitin-protein ligase UBR1 isoform X1 [Drosophila yakuba]|uniref:E3 ubiquitin-protein ligase UBR1 isoform X1 n=1 Tax=Drosophila yakuba TaxID=7245 RepID=UPI0019308437|nr:E3 ubiquitin-protein ligase UBR1 isoform X1 [Drosophila yakuba]XP_039233642.1 E3 ubiquitin-protein ligase UBR1 isoform X1 [Drosophila yakuba]XP_039233643.1 E3 ubiquitin-protein ligase UBR1 isoform X1 [Drosophila yakuba]XP_039233644.1 E3 ubiquitin-protein ligase UBR1 isoform X1 [Drosophila yakuba]
MDRYDMEDVVVAPPAECSSPLKEWRLKRQAGTLDRSDIIEFLKRESPKYFDYQTSGTDTDTNAITRCRGTNCLECGCNHHEHGWGQGPTNTDNLRVGVLFHLTHAQANMVPEIKRLRCRMSLICGSIKCMFKESLAKEEIIDVVVEFMLGDNPSSALEKLRLEGNTATVCGKVFKNGEPTYSCRECGVDPTCVLCVNCFKRSAHRFHKYKMSTSGGGGCCDCGDDEAWKKDHYCELHLANRKNPLESKILTDAVLERVEICFGAILAFCVSYLEIEPNASLQCLDGNVEGGQVDGAQYCTVLYNDESHTFDQVIQTLTKIAKCRPKDAMEIVAAIDREGRAVVKCDTFEECNKLKESIENQMILPTALLSTARNNQSLRTSVLHIGAVACQQFALQLLGWFQEFLVRHYLFRKTFSELVQRKQEAFCIRHILEYDVKLWKTARTCWHRLLISGMLMEYDNKMVLAQEFSRRYATIVEDFISDDHDHAFSIVSLSVQLFTVPSIAHHLIAHEGIFNKLVHTFYHVAIEKFIRNKTLHFSKNIASLTFFKRANYILYDLRYLLSLKPEVMSNDLRSGFLEGCRVLMRVLNVMQGMESITRQTGQHMDYEPEWECAFNLHIKLATTISQVIEWASGDVKLLRKLYKMTLRALVGNSFIVGGERTVQPKKVAGHLANCLVYDVAVQPVSIHLPLSRFYAGIYLHLGAHDLTYDELQTETDALSIKLTPREIIEPVLCTQAMIAQVAAGMWRRNGYTLLHQLYFYRNVRCRVEMLDRDIACLQIGASLMESNEFLIHVLNKFNMIPWLQETYWSMLSDNDMNDEILREASIFDEFLELLIVIIGERWMPGVSMVTEEDRLRKEIIQLLCIKSYSHSELSRALPDGNSGNNDIIFEDVINTVAVFKKPVGADSKGVYELKEHLLVEFNMYFYHYTKEDKSKAEEQQRERRKAKKQLVCCPPPMLPQLTPAFTSMANILQCPVFLNICTLVMNRALNVHSRSFTESHLQKVLHLLGFAIQEELSEHYSFLSFYERSQQYGILEKLEELARCPRLEAHYDFVLWTIERYKQLQAKQAPSDGGAGPSGSQQSAGEELPLSSEEQARKEKENRARLAAERRAQIMAQMQNAQKSFMNSNAEMFAATDKETREESASTGAMDWADIPSEEEQGAVALKPNIACLGPNRKLYQGSDDTFKCILCFEICAISRCGPPLVSSAFVQTSRVIYTTPNLRSSQSALHMSCCGHVMHYNCWLEYFSNEEFKELRRPHRNRAVLGNQSANVEFHCPYCRTLSNTVLPVTEALPAFSPAPTSTDSYLPLDSFVEIMSTLAIELGAMKDDEVAQFPSLSNILRMSGVVGGLAQFERSVQLIKNPTRLHADFSELMQFLNKTLLTNFMQIQKSHFKDHPPTEPNPECLELVSMLWDTCSYTLQALEIYLFVVQKPLKSELSMRHQSCARNLVRACSLRPSLRFEAEFSARLLDTVFNQNGTSVLEWDCFRVLVPFQFGVLNLMVPEKGYKSIIPSGSMFDFYILQTMFLANLTKAVLCFDVDKETAERAPNSELTQLDYVEQLPSRIRDNMVAFYRRYNIPARVLQKNKQKQLAEEDTEENQSHEQTVVIPCESHHLALLLEYVQQQMSSFLRCSCLFYRFLTDVEFPDTFPTDHPDRFDLMCQYLGLDPMLGVYFDMETVYATMMHSFASHPHIDRDVEQRCQPEARRSLQLEPCLRPLPRLKVLCDDFSDLINSVSDIFCPNNEREAMKTPTMCLICGSILCGQSYCCQPELDKVSVGACTHHAHACGAEVGIFLRIRDCQVVYLGRGKGCFIPPPYLDEYGETDMGLRRGNPLRLCQAAYSKIFLQWLGHGLHEEIARLNDNTNVAAAQWHHM